MVSITRTSCCFGISSTLKSRAWSWILRTSLGHKKCTSGEVFVHGNGQKSTVCLSEACKMIPPNQEVTEGLTIWKKKQESTIFESRGWEKRVYFGHRGLAFHCIANRFDIKSGNPKIQHWLQRLTLWFSGIFRPWLSQAIKSTNQEFLIDLFILLFLIVVFAFAFVFSFFLWLLLVQTIRSKLYNKNN